MKRVDAHIPIRIGIPGGRAAPWIVSAILGLPDDSIQHIILELIDERLSGERNYDTIMHAGIEQAIRAGRVPSSILHTMTPGRSYHKDTDRLDILVASSGEDGHFASLFPGATGASLQETHDPPLTCIVNDAPKEPPDRVTFTYQGIEALCSDATIDLLFLGESKREALIRCLEGDETRETLPCRFLIQTFPDITIITDITDVPMGETP